MKRLFCIALATALLTGCAEQQRKGSAAYGSAGGSGHASHHTSTYPWWMFHRTAPAQPAHSSHHATETHHHSAPPKVSAPKAPTSHRGPSMPNRGFSNPVRPSFRPSYRGGGS